MAMTSDEITGAIEALSLITGAAAEFKKIDAEERMHILDRSLQEQVIELEASKSMYNENMRLYYDNKSMVDNLEQEYGKTVGSLKGLNDLYRNSGLDVTIDTYKGEASNYQARADHHLKNAKAEENKMKILRENIYNIESIDPTLIGKQEYARRYAQYVDANIADNMLDPTEFDMMVNDLRKEKNEEIILDLSNKIKLMESGDRAQRTNNPGAMIWSDWQADFGGVKKEEHAFWEYDVKDEATGKVITKQAFVESNIPEGVKARKYYTTEFPDVESGEEALHKLVKEKWGQASGSLDSFVSSYTGLDPNSPEFTGYRRAMGALDILDDPELTIKAMTEEYYSAPIEQKMIYNEELRQGKADQSKNISQINYQMLGGLREADGWSKFAKRFGKPGSRQRNAVETALAQGSVETFYAFLKENPAVENYIINKVKLDNSEVGSKFKSFFDQTMKGMDDYSNLMFPGLEAPVSNTINKYIDTSNNPEEALMHFISTTQGTILGENERAEAYDDFIESIIEKWGEDGKAIIERKMKQMNDELIQQDSLDAIAKIAESKIQSGRISYDLNPKE